MKSRFVTTLIILLFLVLVPTISADDAWSFDLVAGQHTTIGQVTVIISGDALSASYQVTVPGWCMSTTHFYAGSTAPDRAAPGQFPYHHENLDCVTSDVFNVATPAGDVYVAAHADTHYDPNAIVDESDPLTGITSINVAIATDSYLNATVSGGVSGTYEAWCIDIYHAIVPGADYTANVYTLADAPDSITAHPENLDLVTYIINQNYSSIGASSYDVQLAIWYFVEGDWINLSDAALAIVEDASANGEGFVPGCGELMAVIVEPIEYDAQHLLLGYPAPCPTSGDNQDGDQRARSETAWALADWGIHFDTGWGMYFHLVDADDQTPSADDPAGSSDPTTDPAPDSNPGGTDEHGNRSRRDEAPGQGQTNTPPASRSDEAPGQQHRNDSGGHGNGG